MQALKRPAVYGPLVESGETLLPGKTATTREATWLLELRASVIARVVRDSNYRALRDGLLLASLVLKFDGK